MLMTFTRFEMEAYGEAKLCSGFEIPEISLVSHTKYLSIHLRGKRVFMIWHGRPPQYIRIQMGMLRNGIIDATAHWMLKIGYQKPSLYNCGL